MESSFKINIKFVLFVFLLAFNEKEQGNCLWVYQ